jgi:hypothetical protein
VKRNIRVQQRGDGIEPFLADRFDVRNRHAFGSLWLGHDALSG